MGTERVIYGRQERPLEGRARKGLCPLSLNISSWNCSKEKGRAVFDILACFYGVTLAR
jgi:hypothetical protein